MEKKKNSIIDRAKLQITGFADMYQKLEQNVVLGGMSNSTLTNYGRCIARISLHFYQAAIDLEEEQINGYLFQLKQGKKRSISYFKHTVYRLRFLFRPYELPDKAIKLPSIKRNAALTVVLSHQEVKRLISSA